MYTAVIIALSFAIAGTIGYQLDKYLPYKEDTESLLATQQHYQELKGYGYQRGFIDGFVLADSEDFDPDEEQFSNITLQYMLATPSMWHSRGNDILQATLRKLTEF